MLYEYLTQLHLRNVEGHTTRCKDIDNQKYTREVKTALAQQKSLETKPRFYCDIQTRLKNRVHRRTKLVFFAIAILLSECKQTVGLSPKTAWLSVPRPRSSKKCHARFFFYKNNHIGKTMLKFA